MEEAVSASDQYFTYRTFWQFGRNSRVLRNYEFKWNVDVRNPLNVQGARNGGSVRSEWQSNFSAFNFAAEGEYADPEELSIMHAPPSQPTSSVPPPSLTDPSAE